MTVLNPGQGHLPVALAQLVQVGQIELVGSDLLALRYSQRNLVLNGLRPENIRTFHRVGLSEESSHEAQLITGLLRGDENAAEAKDFANELSDQIVPGGYVAVAGSSTAITRLESAARENSGLAVETRKKRRGSSLLVLRGK